MTDLEVLKELFQDGCNYRLSACGEFYCFDVETDKDGNENVTISNEFDHIVIKPESIEIYGKEVYAINEDDLQFSFDFVEIKYLNPKDELKKLKRD